MVLLSPRVGADVVIYNVFNVGFAAMTVVLPRYPLALSNMAKGVQIPSKPVRS